ncbi:regulator of replication initiation timing [Enterococcus sp. PF1-24]|uniref:DNA replication initiation control protein YabA n=1 Tax=unclassified Enterococcus TaxID=2608891 RepID=UPI00247537D5|nr:MULTISPECIES: DNA replication initiation control protein YabA [unclassified Enterococcus]MDH6364785.1 regulator of replication initiation timing [Enterococcus sp. PFB1-1]MDH6401870.1 regulator of replication initiation timing [Enterococcus sp. PF1-24]
MDKRSLYDGLNCLENELRKTLDELVEMKEVFQQVVEKNATLEMENQRLREHLREITQEEQAATKDKKNAPPSQARKNLEKIYEEGFHVCYDYYGTRREKDSPCLFCLSLIDK